MPRKFKYKFSRKKSDYDKYSEKLSLGHRRLLFGTTDVIRNGIDALEVNVTKKVMRMFHVYLKIKLQEKDQNDMEIQTVYIFMQKFIFGNLYDADYFKEYDVNTLKNLFSKYYGVFVQDTTDDDSLARKLLQTTKSEKLDYFSISDLEKDIIVKVQDYIDFLDFYYVSQILKLDNFINDDVEKRYMKNPASNLTNKTNRAKLTREIKLQIAKEKVELLEQTMKRIRKDLVEYLKGEEFIDVAGLVISNYDHYQWELNQFLYPGTDDPDDQKLENNNTNKIRTHMNIFDLMNELKMNWIYDCSAIKGDGSCCFYVYIYDIVMYKYKLVAYLFLHELDKRTKQEVLDSLEKIESYNKDEMAYDFFTRKIHSSEKINAHIINLFEKKYRKFPMRIFAIGTNTPYKKNIVTPTFFSLVDIHFKHAPLAALKYFPIIITAKEYLRNPRL